VLDGSIDKGLQTYFLSSLLSESPSLVLDN